MVTARGGREGGTAAVAGTSEEVSPEPGVPPGLRRLSPAFLQLTEAVAGAVLHARRHVAGWISPVSLALSQVQHRSPSVATAMAGGSARHRGKMLGFFFQLCTTVCDMLLTFRNYVKVNPGQSC